MSVISIFGGTGFIGSELIDNLSKKKIEIRIFTQSKKKLEYFSKLSNVKLFFYKHPKDVQSNISGSDVIINLVGILHESRNHKFNDAHQEFTKNIIDIAIQEKVKRYIQFKRN